MSVNGEGTKNREFEEILEALDGAPKGLEVDSIVAVLALKNSIEIEQSLIDLLKQGKIKARYKGDKTKDVNPDLFVYLKADEENKTGE